MQASVLDRFPMPPCAKTLGFELLKADAAQGTVCIRFQARSPLSAIQPARCRVGF